MKQSFVSLKGRDNFQRITRKGRGTRGENLRLSVISGVDEVNVVGIIVSKKVSGKAVVRNKIRRRIKGVVDGWFKRNNARGVEVVIGVNLAAAEADYAALKSEIEKILKRLIGDGNDKKDSFSAN